MALISTKGIYGLSAMYELFLASGVKPMQIKDIAKNADIPQNYLEQILVALKKANLVKSIRGAHGGYLLAKESKDIFLKDIFLALEKDLHITETKTSSNTLNLFYKKSNEKLSEIFDISLEELHRNFHKKPKTNLNFTTFGL